MGFLCSVYNYSIRMLFSAFIVFMGLKGLSDANITHKYVDQTLSLVGETYKLDLAAIKNYSVEIVFFQNFLLIFGGLLCLFGFYLRKFFITSGLVLFVLLIKNPYFYGDKVSCSCVKVLSLIGATLLS